MAEPDVGDHTMTLDEIKAAIDEGRARYLGSFGISTFPGRVTVSIEIIAPETEAQKIAKTFAANCAWEWPTLARRIQDAIDAAIAAERKACEEMERTYTSNTVIADRIAARGTK